MKGIIRLLCAALVALTVPYSFAQRSGPVSSATYSAGTYYSFNYNYGAGRIAPMKVTTGTSTSGAGTVTVSFGYFSTPDGRQIFPFTGVTTIPPITIDSGANLETVTPSSVSCTTPSVINTCTITATFSNIHGNGVNVSSGDQGLQEAFNDAAANGGGQVYWSLNPGAITLSTSAANTNAGTLSIPTRSFVMGATARVTTTITGCAGGWSLGFSSGTEFTAANTGLTAGTTTDTSTLVAPVVYNAAATIPVIHCTTGNASAGVVHPKFWGYKMVAPIN